MIDIINFTIMMALFLNFFQYKVRSKINETELK